MKSRERSDPGSRLYIRYVMKNYLKIPIRNLIRNPVSGFVIIAGFAFSLAVALLLASYVFNEAVYDKSFPEP